MNHIWHVPEHCQVRHLSGDYDVADAPNLIHFVHRMLWRGLPRFTAFLHKVRGGGCQNPRPNKSFAALSCPAGLAKAAP